VFINYKHQNEIELDNEPSEIEQDMNLKKNMMIHIEGEDNILDDDDDMLMSHQLKTFLDDLK
jgi:hypothetical protein